MILTCPECTTRFMVPDDALRPAGRTVKCGKCSHRWFADPPSGIDALADAVEAATAADSHDAYDPVRVTPFDPKEQAPFRPPNLPAIAQPVPRGATLAAWGLLVAMVVELGAILWFGRGQIVAAMPMVQPLYQTVGVCVGIADPEASFSFVGTPKPSRAASGELLISGELRRDSDCATYVPHIIVEFLDTKRTVLQRTTYPVGIGAIETGKPTPFALKITEWPDDIADVNLVFTIPNVQG
jgi:predicted Zn finger-like uncharacterized protein